MNKQWKSSSKCNRTGLCHNAYWNLTENKPTFKINCKLSHNLNGNTKLFNDWILFSYFLSLSLTFCDLSLCVWVVLLFFFFWLQNTHTAFDRNDAKLLHNTINTNVTLRTHNDILYAPQFSLVEALCYLLGTMPHISHSLVHKHSVFLSFSLSMVRFHSLYLLDCTVHGICFAK